MPAQTHGADGAIKKLGSGAELAGIARDAEIEARAIYETSGAVELVLTNAARHQAASQLCWEAVQAAAQSGDHEKVDRYLARFGWLNAGAARQWVELAKLAKHDDRESMTRTVLDAIKAAQDDQS